MKTIYITYWSVNTQSFHTSTAQVENVEQWNREINPAEVFKTGGVIGNVRVECNGRIIINQIEGRDLR